MLIKCIEGALVIGFFIWKKFTVLSTSDKGFEYFVLVLTKKKLLILLSSSSIPAYKEQF